MGATTKPAEHTQDIDRLSRLDLSLQSTSRQLSISKLQALVRQALHMYTRIPETDLLNISLALEEAMLNGHEHGNLELESTWKEEHLDGFTTTRFNATKQERLSNADYADRQLNVYLRIWPDKIALTVEDGGKGFDAGVVSNDVEIKPHGMGLLLINNLMDAVRFDRAGSSITFEKRIPSPNEGSYS